MKLLIIEDSERLCKTLCIGFVELGYTVDGVNDGREGLNLALNSEYDVIILDLMLPSMDGLSVLKTLRDKRNKSKVLILSAKDEVEDRVKGLNVGADDYLCKPFSFAELHARVNNLLKRTYDIKSDQIALGGVIIQLSRRQALITSDNTVQNVLDLTPHEYSILEHLALNQGRVISYDKLTDYLYDEKTVVTRNAIEAHMSGLRKKLRLAGIDSLISTRRGFGYVIEMQ